MPSVDVSCPDDIRRGLENLARYGLTTNQWLSMANSMDAATIKKVVDAFPRHPRCIVRRRKDMRRRVDSCVRRSLQGED